jgi:pyridinium-3,5-bisthiocarboxylic acid mononucleotide nickel chelatase
MIAYFDCFAGIAGDMILGAMIDAGLPLAHLQESLRPIQLPSYAIHHVIGRRKGLGGSDVTVEVTGADTHARRYVEILEILSSSGLDSVIKDRALAIFERLAVAEARAHRTDIQDVHFHEVGMTDAIVDIVGAVIGFQFFQFDAIYFSPLPVTRGFVNSAHGRWPLPAPAALELVRDVPLVAPTIAAELVTPTGAAIITTMGTPSESCPLRRVTTTGYGLGDQDFAEFPNALRLMIGEGERLIAVEVNIDDMNPEFYEHVIDRLIAVGAIDVAVRPVTMKKRRPGMQIQLLCEESLRGPIEKVILSETTSFGLRYYPVDRTMLSREVRAVETPYGQIPVKYGWLDGECLQVSPEYEVCRKIATREGVALKEVYRLASAAALG